MNFEPAALVLTLLCLIYSLTTKKRQYSFSSNGIAGNWFNQHFVFIMLLISVIMSAASSVAGVFLAEISSETIVFWQYFFHAVYFFFHNALSPGFALYIMHVNGASARHGKRFYALFFLPFAICELIVLTNSITGAAFYMDDEFVYHRGSLIMLLYACGLFYLILAFVYFFRYKKAISDTDSKAIGILMVLSAVGVIVQGIRSELIVELFAESLSLLGMMMMLEERSGYTDPATGTLNRVALIDASRRLIETHQSARLILVKLTNMDLFTKLFDGREMDSLLMQVASWLKSISSEDYLYYYRSESFAIQFPGALDDEANDIAQKILTRFGQDWKSGEVMIRLDAAVSVVKMPKDISTMEDVMELLASGYRVKAQGSRLVSFEEIAAHRDHRRIEQALREAVDGKKLRVWYQPIWSVEEKRTVAAEALLRIDSDALRKFSPEVYIPIAEQCGIIREIGMFVFEDVCRMLQNERLKELGLSYIELNLSLYQFMYDDIVTKFEAIRTRYGIPVSALNLEITESASIGRAPAIMQTMEQLREKGYTFSLDDFGTGYSNMKQLISSRYKNVKIDKSLLWDAEHSESTSRLLDGLIRVIRSLDYNVVQEGVETSSQLERTANSGGNYIQGYYFSRPIPEDDFIEYMENEAKKRVS